MLDLVPPDQHVSIEREVWPRLVGNGLYGFTADAYWLDIGTPERYLQGTFDILEGNVRDSGGTSASATGYLAVAEDARDRRPRRPARASSSAACAIAAGAHVGSLVVLGGGVDVGARQRASSARVVLQGAEIGADCVLRDCIVGPGVRIGDRTQVTSGAVLGEGVTIGADNVVTRGARVFPGMELPDGAIRF